MIKYTDEEYYYAINYNKVYNYMSQASRYDTEMSYKRVRWLIEMMYEENSNSAKIMQDVIRSFPRYKKLHDTIALLR